MDDSSIKVLVKKWQTRLKLDHWSVTLELVKSPKNLDGRVSDCSFNYKYLTATVRLAKKTSAGNAVGKHDIIKNLIHELLHLHTAGMNIIIDTPEHTAEEQAIEILSRVIKEAYEN